MGQMANSVMHESSPFLQILPRCIKFEKQKEQMQNIVLGSSSASRFTEPLFLIHTIKFSANHHLVCQLPKRKDSNRCTECR